MTLRCSFAIILLTISIQPLPAQNEAVDHWESVIYPEDTWNYYVGITSGPPSGWQQPAFDDTGWLQGQGGFGYGDADDQTSLAVPPNPTAIYIRVDFTIIDTSEIGIAVLNMDFDDGFAAWINGVEIARSNLGTAGDYPAFNAPAADHEALVYQGQKPPAFVLNRKALSTCLINGINVLAIQVNNSGSGSSDMSCIPCLSVGMRSVGMTYRNVPAWFEIPYTGFTASHLPLVIIRTGTEEIKQDEKTMVTMGVIDKGAGELNYPADEWNTYNGKAGIEIRGSSSTGFPKKNYGIELWKEDGADTACSLMGLSPESDWILHGPYSDKSLIRNHLAYDLARNMGHYAPRSRFCELFLNDQYQGVYVFMERIKRDSARVDISELNPEDIAGDQLTGGYIVKIDRSAGNYTDGWFSPYPGTGMEGSSPFFAFHYPQRDQIIPVQKNYIRNSITRFESALHGSSYRDPYTGYKTHIDINSFVDYFILVELSKNTDGYRLSTFLHKDRDSKDPRIHMGPVWDYDLAFGNADYYEAYNTSGWNYTVLSDGWGTPFWWSRMLTDPYFTNLLYCRWHEFRQGVLSDDSMLARIDTAISMLGPSTDRNFIQWPIHGVYIWPNPYVGNTYAQDITYMKNWITDRAAWMDSHIPGNTCLSDLNENVQSFLLRAYPNPAHGEVNIEIQNERSGNLTLQVYDMSGQLIFSRYVNGDIMITEKLNLRPGAYLVKVFDQSSLRTTKVLIQ